MADDRQNNKQPPTDEADKVRHPGTTSNNAPNAVQGTSGKGKPGAQSTGKTSPEQNTQRQDETAQHSNSTRGVTNHSPFGAQSGKEGNNQVTEPERLDESQ